LTKTHTKKTESQSYSKLLAAISNISIDNPLSINIFQRLYATTLVDIVKTNLKDKKENGISKFISLYVILSTYRMDTRELELVHAVRDNLIKILGELAKSKISEIFPPETGRC
jgi:hypothetical protein